MRLLHPTTLKIISERDDIPKSKISNVWAEIFKWLANGKSHPKMFIDSYFHLGIYLRIVYKYGIINDCKLDISKILKLNKNIQFGFNTFKCNKQPSRGLQMLKCLYFDDNYLFSDACSLYYKGYNIFPDIFGDDWKKYCPVISLKEIKRQVDKTLSK